LRDSITESNLEEKILNLLRENLLSTSSLARELGIRRDIVAGYLEALKNQGKLRFSKVGRAYVYTINRRERK